MANSSNTYVLRVNRTNHPQDTHVSFNFSATETELHVAFNAFVKTLLEEKAKKEKVDNV